jgi:ribosomal protein S18 acetylase RimI-like enzyme
MVVYEGNTIIGVASIHIIYKLSRTLGLIEDVAVNKDHRGKGIGKSLVEKLIEIGKQKNCDKIVLNTSEKNSKFYEKIGFEKNEIQMVIRN